MLRTLVFSRSVVRQLQSTSTLQARASSSGASQQRSDGNPPSGDKSTKQQEKLEQIKQKKKTMAEADEEMRKAMEGLAGDGGESGVELEDGKAVAMKRGVRENMFRYI
jgi:hypothetical protein